MQNGHVESFNGRLRDERLNANWFRNLMDAKAKISAWLDEYHGERPPNSRGYRTPNGFAVWQAWAVRLSRPPGIIVVSMRAGGSRARIRPAMDKERP